MGESVFEHSVKAVSSHFAREKPHGARLLKGPIRSLRATSRLFLSQKWQTLIGRNENYAGNLRAIQRLLINQMSNRLIIFTLEVVLLFTY